MRMKRSKKALYYIIPNRTKDPGLVFARRVARFLREQKEECRIWSEDERFCAVPEEEKKRKRIALVLGGDGTVLRAVHDMHTETIPVLGINLGTVGYLAEIEKSGYRDALLRLLDGKYYLEKRMMLSGEIRTRAGKKKKMDGAEVFTSLNDIVLMRQGSLRILQFKVYVGGRVLNAFHADGVIVSTPTGSTAYNLSAGGPIVEPTAEMVLLTPICAHELVARSIVLSAGQEIMIELVMEKNRTEEDAACRVVFDGVEELEMEPGERILIRPAERRAQLIKLRRTSFLDTLRTKLEHGSGAN